MVRDAPTYLISLCIKRMLEGDDIGVEKLLHYLELSVLISFVLIHLLDRYDLPRFSHGSLLAHRAMRYTYELTWKTTPNEPFPTTLSALYVKLVYK